jgi:hypothetical protein
MNDEQSSISKVLKEIYIKEWGKHVSLDIPEVRSCA